MANSENLATTARNALANNRNSPYNKGVEPHSRIPPHATECHRRHRTPPHQGQQRWWRTVTSDAEATTVVALAAVAAATATAAMVAAAGAFYKIRVLWYLLTVLTYQSHIKTLWQRSWHPITLPFTRYHIWILSKSLLRSELSFLG